MDFEAIAPYSQKFKAYLLVGPPGSGKGTQGKLLEQVNLGKWYHLSSGDIFRGLSKDSPGGKLFHQFAHKGQLVPDEETIKIWYYYVNGLILCNQFFPKEQALLLDGIPRTLEQAKLIDTYIDVQKVFVFEMQDFEALTARLIARSKKENRKDDAAREIIETRMQVYQETTLKVLEHYPEELIHRVNADQTPQAVLSDLLTCK